MAEPAQRHWTVEEFLAWDDGTDRRYELVRGKIVEIPLQPEAHGAIVATMGALLHGRLERPFRALIRGGVVPPDRDHTYYQADLLVTCGKPEPGRQYPPAPVLIAEIVSRSTAFLDHGQSSTTIASCPPSRRFSWSPARSGACSTGVVTAPAGWSTT